MKIPRYHIQLSRHRTTIVLDKTIAELLAIRLNIKPGTKEAHLAYKGNSINFFLMTLICQVLG